jgi:hypothetical protein
MELRNTKPTLFLAVIAAASGKVDPHLYSLLSSEVLIAYANRAVLNNEKSLELVQAMLVTCIWYSPPGKFSASKFFEYIQMAATMAVDIGLSKGSIARRGKSEDQPQILDEEALERRRTILACYLITTGLVP